MKTPVSRIWIPGLVLAVWLPVGIAQIETNHSTSKPATAPAPSPVFPEITSPKDSPSLPSSTSGDLVLKRQPPKMRLSPWTTEIVKLAESGIEESIILSFIENSGTFNLGADQIVYLNDLGLASEIISAMLRHDQEIVSGARPLTIVSEPTWEPFSELTFKPLQKAKQPVPALNSETPVDLTKTTSPEASLGNASPEVMTQLAAMVPNQTAIEYESVQTTTFSPRQQPTAKKSSPYRVREPHPEEVTAPIILIYGESRPPNTVVVVGFPQPTR